jgi:hypothetical protein
VEFSGVPLTHGSHWHIHIACACSSAEGQVWKSSQHVLELTRGSDCEFSWGEFMVSPWWNTMFQHGFSMFCHGETPWFCHVYTIWLVPIGKVMMRFRPLRTCMPPYNLAQSSDQMTGKWGDFLGGLMIFNAASLVHKTWRCLELFLLWWLTMVKFCISFNLIHKKFFSFFSYCKEIVHYRVATCSHFHGGKLLRRCFRDDVAEAPKNSQFWKIAFPWAATEIRVKMGRWKMHAISHRIHVWYIC